MTPFIWQNSSWKWFHVMQWRNSQWLVDSEILLRTRLHWWKHCPRQQKYKMEKRLTPVKTLSIAAKIVPFFLLLRISSHFTSVIFLVVISSYLFVSIFLLVFHVRLVKRPNMDFFLFRQFVLFIGNPYNSGHLWNPIICFILQFCLLKHLHVYPGNHGSCGKLGIHGNHGNYGKLVNHSN